MFTIIWFWYTMDKYSIWVDWNLTKVMVSNNCYLISTYNYLFTSTYSCHRKNRFSNGDFAFASALTKVTGFLLFWDLSFRNFKMTLTMFIWVVFVQYMSLYHPFYFKATSTLKSICNCFLCLAKTAVKTNRTKECDEYFLFLLNLHIFDANWLLIKPFMWDLFQINLLERKTIKI